jgi:glycerophosphoryl diester phosphodiesterase
MTSSRGHAPERGIGRRRPRARWWLAGGLVVMAAAGAAWSIAAWPNAGAPVTALARSSSAETAGCIRDPACRRVFVVAHRAEGFGGPENSRAAVRSAVDAGVPVIEIDLRGAVDGPLFALHDGKLERYTRDLAGRVDETPSAAIARARLGNGETIPRFEDLYAIARGRAVLSVDFKVSERAMAGAADWLAAHGSFDDVIFFANTGEEMAVAARMKQRYPRMIVMVRLLDTRVTVASTRAVFGGRLPEILHTDRVGADEVARLHALGVKVYVNAVPLERYVPPFRSFAIRALLRTGVDFVLSGDPGAMMRRVETISG